MAVKKYMCTHIHTYEHIYIYIYTYTSMYICMYMYVNTSTYGGQKISPKTNISEKETNKIEK